MLARNAPQAILNRGEAAWRDGDFGPTTNASKAALFDELTSLFWRRRRANGERGRCARGPGMS